MTSRFSMVSALALLIAGQANAQEQAAPSAAPMPADDPAVDDSAQDIVVTGIRSSLERAAEIKRDATQVVDSIVAQDIGKLPDPSTAAALQRVPGVQVQNDRNNELGGVRIRGLTDILTTVDGREVFTANGRGFDLQDLPAEALARVDVFKSQTADLIEGGVAGAIDLKLNKPFNFRDPTVVLSARENYGVRVGRGNPQFGVLLTDRWDTPLGEIGLLVNATYSNSESLRAQSNMTDRRSSGVAPLNTPGFLIPNVIQNMPDTGTITRKQVNAALQWQVSDALEAYVDGLYTDFETTAGFIGFNSQPFTSSVRVTDIVPSDNCFLARVNAQGQNPTIVNNANGPPTLQPHTVQTLCDFKSATFENVVINQNSSSRLFTQQNKLIAGGLRYDRDALRANIEIAYQSSDNNDENVNAEVGQRVPTLHLETDFEDGPRFTVGDQYPLSRDNLSLRNQFNQNFTRAEGSLFQAKSDTVYELGGWLTELQFGARYAKREAVLRQVLQSTPVPFGNIGTPTEANARLISTLPLPPEFLTSDPYAPRLNGGTHFLGVNPEFLRSEEGRNTLRAIFGRPLGQPDYEPTRQFDAREDTYAAYFQGKYELPLSGDITIDGVVGVRLTRTDRTISTFRQLTGQPLTPVSAQTSDTDILPNATARIRFPGGLQSRFSYSKAIRRPDFGVLNPSLALTRVNNVFLLNTGSAGNPDLRPQKSDSYDATLEYYFPSGFVAVTGYYRTITDRVVSSSSLETYDGLDYIISRPRNLGRAELKGIEVNGQYFFDFLPGALSGFGAMGAFTYADSQVKGNDQLVGVPLQGVSKYNYTAGLLYDKSGLSGRLIYTFRSRYFSDDVSGQVQVRPVDPDRAIDDVYVPTLLTYVRPAGRLDFSLGYDVTERFRIDVGGTNILQTSTKTYRGLPFLNNFVLDDETTYTIGVRVRL